MTQFEYKVIEISDLESINSTADFEAQLNEFGKEGWQLAPSPDFSLLVLMRPKENGRTSVSHALSVADVLDSEGYGA